MSPPRQAIRTYMIPITATKVARMAARAQAGIVYVDYVYEESLHDNGWRAAQKLIDKYDWPKEEWVAGMLDDGFPVFTHREVAATSTMNNDLHHAIVMTIAGLIKDYEDDKDDYADIRARYMHDPKYLEVVKKAIDIVKSGKLHQDE